MNTSAKTVNQEFWLHFCYKQFGLSERRSRQKSNSFIYLANFLPSFQEEQQQPLFIVNNSFILIYLDGEETRKK